MEDSLADEKFKVLVVGDKSVGKTSFIRKFTEDIFSSDVLSSPCINFFYRKIKVEEKVVLLNIFDAPSSTANQNLTNLYFAKVDAVIIVYDVTDPSWHIGVSYWLNEIQKKSHEYSVVCLIGNKQDLIQTAYLAGNGNFEKFTSLIDLYDVISCKYSERLEKLWIGMVTLIHQKENSRLERFQKQYILSDKTVIDHKRKPSPTHNVFVKLLNKICKRFLLLKY
ncbi:hypothetical protein LOTGIDRAFT_112904 [Lottia gigantea]|uniref:Uncharacterized protein n=1 Tax=Lottia gigantea TaxID=225164 RepID=V4B143_LOTGI|nr:hypothetical protein LOTGIDRAFT_112904 [Lottia gigantea]ESO99961.1 hypothetical protein LOTGIDRAFT_112904 [Lottia gigantea]